MTDSTSVTRSHRTVHPSAQALGDAILIVQGAYAPLDRFVCAEEGRRIRDRGQLVDGAAFPVPVTLVVSRTDVPDLADGHTVVLVDAEGASLAEVSVDSLWDAGGSHVDAAARCDRWARPSTRSHDSRTPHETSGSALWRRAPSASSWDRPLLAAEVSALAEISEDGPVVLLVRSIDPTVPVDVLTKATLAAASAVPGSEVLTSPFAQRDDRVDDDDSVTC